MFPKAELKEKIVIIGAGLAGLTTAYRLLQKQYDIELYEARSRVGGRVHTVLLKNLEGGFSPAELGAQNLTDGGDSQLIFNLIREMNLEIVDKVADLDAEFYDGDQYILKSQILKKLHADSHILKKIDKVALKVISLQDVLEHVFKENTLAIRMFSFMLNAYEGLPPRLLSTQPHNIETLKYMIAGGLSQAHQSEEIHHMSIKDGNGLLPLKLAEKLDKRLILNRVLTKVRLNANHEMELNFSDKSIVLCNKLILAMPASVYKDIDFDEKLIPSNRLKRIHAMEYGTNGKILLPFQASNIYKKFIFNDYVGFFFNQDYKLLNCYFINDNGINLFDKEMYKRILSFLKNAFTTVDLPNTPPHETVDLQFVKANNPVIKSWIRDPYAQGSYSAYDIFLQKNIDEKENYQHILVKKMFAPINDRIFFVGEHTSIIDAIGTMEAAVESGERIAQLFR